VVPLVIMYQSALLLCLVSSMLCSFVAMYGLLDLVRTSCMRVLCYAPDGSDAMYALLPVGPVTLFVTLGAHVMLSLVFCPIPRSCLFFWPTLSCLWIGVMLYSSMRCFLRYVLISVMPSRGARPHQWYPVFHGSSRLQL
jgi:hypothetical protein